MPTSLPRGVEQVLFESAAQDYLRSLPLEHFAEAISQGRQRAITLASLALVRARRPAFQYFNELLVQYRLPRQRNIRQVVPDNMVVLWDEPIGADGSYDVPLQPTAPFWVLDYVSKHNKRKDYDDNRRKYEHELKVPYYLLFQPEIQELTLYRHKSGKYRSVKPNAQQRYAIPEVEVEVALLDRWARFWYQGELLRQPEEMQRELEIIQHARDENLRKRDEARQEIAQLRAEIAKLRSRGKKGP